MFSLPKGFRVQAASNYTNPYAVDVIRAKRSDLVHGISNTEDLLDHLVAEGVMTADKRSIVLAIRSRRDQNCRVLDILEARGERACRKFFHPCLMMAEPDLYQQIKTYVGGVNECVRDTRRQLIGYLLERERDGMVKTTHGIEDRSVAPLLKPEEQQTAQSKADHLIHMIATDGKAALLEELLEDTDINTVTSSNETLLHEAAEHGHLSIIEHLIRKGATLDLQDSKGHTALHRAASRGHTNIVNALVQAGAPIYSLDLQGRTPVHLAAENEHLSSVKVLVEEERKHSESHKRDMFLHSAAMEDNWRLAEMLLQSGAAVNARNKHEKTPLFSAVSRNNEKTVAVLLKAGAKVDLDVIKEAIMLNEESILHLLLDSARGALSEEELGSALLSAVRQNHDGLVTVLIDRGANVNVFDKQGYTPLLLSAELGHSEVLRVLVAKQAKLDATLSDGSSALHLAVHSGSAPIVQTLLGKGLDPNTTGPKAQTPLHLAAQCNRPELVDLLLRARAQVNAAAQDGLTPLHVASQQGHADPVIRLLQGKADPGIKDRLGRTALHWAASSPGDSGVVDLLLTAKTNPHTTDNEKKTALHQAAIAGRVDALTSLLSHKAKAGAKDMDGSTPLHYAAAGGHATVVSALLQSLNNKGVDERNVWRKTPLHTAADKGHNSVAVVLLGAGAKINSADNSKDTPLHSAARGGHQEVVKTLLNWGQGGHMGRRKKANLQVTNNVGKTPLQVAESGDTSEHKDIVILLQKKMLLIK
ncbi:CARD- and ANK-containing Inflammasome Adaptor Protein [Acanthopagrus latus]|uniref:CARD- and ANK-containing Inflammasome Adaptor Protein n=1 Tax=Acanthopagrus latus TaxID=8177 RepID=UPI00187C58D0|nr:CARD- and ANK-containing Inflammasome Adaptor Protein [Acanthopagrus latus]